MARNPELDHEFNENRTQQKPVIFTSADMNGMPGPSGPKMTNSGFLGELSTNGNARTGLKTWQKVAIIVGLIAAAGLIGWAVATIQQTYFPPVY